VRIEDTLSLANIEVSQTYAGLVKRRADLAALEEPREMEFDATENLAPLK